MYLGVDPGLKNIGIALTDNNNKILFTHVYDINTYDNKLTDLINILIREICVEGVRDIKQAYIERFVPYKNMHSSSEERILMFIGGLKYALEIRHYDVVMTRAIDWKVSLCKYLYKHKNFRNPSKSFDKKYSVAAAQCLTGIKSPTDHEADAICLSSLWIINNE